MDDNLTAWNDLCAWQYALSKDCPAKWWWHAPATHPAIYRALKIDPTEPGAVYAAAPFRLYKREGCHIILAAWPCPRIFGEPDPDWLGIEAVMAWNPVANSVEVMGDTAPQLIGAFASHDAGDIFATPFAFFRAWAEQRASFATAYLKARSAHFTAAPAERDTPGMVIIGEPERVPWMSYDLPATLHCMGITPSEINKAILRGSNLPRAVNSMKAAA